MWECCLSCVTGAALHPMQMKLRRKAGEAPVAARQGPWVPRSPNVYGEAWTAGPGSCGAGVGELKRRNFEDPIIPGSGLNTAVFDS